MRILRGVFSVTKTKGYKGGTSLIMHLMLIPPNNMQNKIRPLVHNSFTDALFVGIKEDARKGVGILCAEEV